MRLTHALNSWERIATICKETHAHTHGHAHTLLPTDDELLLEAATPGDVSHVALLLWWVGGLMGLTSSSSTLRHEITSASRLFVFSSSLPPRVSCSLVLLPSAPHLPHPPNVPLSLPPSPSVSLRPPFSTFQPAHSFLTDGCSNGAAVTLTVGQRRRILVKTSGGTTVARLCAACGDHVTPGALLTVSLHLHRDNNCLHPSRHHCSLLLEFVDGGHTNSHNIGVPSFNTSLFLDKFLIFILIE